MDAREIAREIRAAIAAVRGDSSVPVRDDWEALVERACAEARAEEREACAKVVEGMGYCGDYYHNACCCLEESAELIRARAKGEADC